MLLARSLLSLNQKKFGGMFWFHWRNACAIVILASPSKVAPRFNQEIRMNDPMLEKTLTSISFDISKEPVPSDPGANPFKLVVDPEMRVRLRRALFEMIESHDQELAKYVSEGSLALESYKEYIELFAHSLKQTMASRDGVAFLLESCGFAVAREQINLQPETRWKVHR
jgi:hypothetical protein